MPIRCVAGFESSARPALAIPAHREPCALVEASRHAISKPTRQEKVRVPFSGPFPVRDTFSKIVVPTEKQAKAYIAMLTSTASLKGDVAAASIFDFSLAEAAARKLAQRK
jgi:hypothetical protein